MCYKNKQNFVAQLISFQFFLEKINFCQHSDNMLPHLHIVAASKQCKVVLLLLYMYNLMIFEQFPITKTDNKSKLFLTVFYSNAITVKQPLTS